MVLPAPRVWIWNRPPVGLCLINTCALSCPPGGTISGGHGNFKRLVDRRCGPWKAQPPLEFLTQVHITASWWYERLCPSLLPPWPPSSGGTDTQSFFKSFLSGVCCGREKCTRRCGSNWNHQTVIGNFQLNYSSARDCIRCDSFVCSFFQLFVFALCLEKFHSQDWPHSSPPPGWA